MSAILINQGAVDDVIEDMIPKPVDTTEDFERFGTELAEKSHRRKL